MSFRKICAALVLAPLAVLSVAFIIANRGMVTLNLDIFAALLGKTGEGGSLTAPLFIWLFVFFGLGLLAGSLAMLPKYYQARRARHQLEAENAKPQAARRRSDDIHL